MASGRVPMMRRIFFKKSGFKKMSGKVLIFHLSRYGYAHYAAGMINHLPFSDCLIFLSKFHSISVEKPFETVYTYRNGFEFFFSSLFVLPVYLCRIFKLLKKQSIGVAYFLGFHYWDLPIIWVCKMCRVAIVYTVHDGILHEGERFLSQNLLQNACIKKASELIFLTEFMRSVTLRKLNINKPSTVIFHGPISLKNLSTHHRYKKKLRLLFLGRIGKYKGIEMLLDAISLAEDEIWELLTIAGMPLYTIEIPKNKKISMVKSWLSEERMAELLNTHDVLVLPYRSATQSGIITLGISAAIPMICTRVGGLVEQLTENEAIWVDSNPESLLKGIRHMSKNPTAYEAIHQNLLIRNKNFSWGEQIGQLAEVFSKILSTSS